MCVSWILPFLAPFKHFLYLITYNFLILLSVADKVKPGAYQHNRVMITPEKIDSIVEASKSKKAAKKKRKREDKEQGEIEEKTAGKTNDWTDKERKSYFSNSTRVLKTRQIEKEGRKILKIS